MNFKTICISFTLFVNSLQLLGQVTFGPLGGGHYNGVYYPHGITENNLSPMCSLNSGKITSLDSVQVVGIEYDYSELKVGMGWDEPEFLTKMAEEQNKKKAGQGDKIKNSWEGFKKNEYEPAFQAAFNKMAAELELGLIGTNYATEKNYTMLIKVVYIAPGPVTHSSKPAILDMECVFVNSQGTELCKLFVKNMTGNDMKFGPEMNERIAHCFHKSAKMLCERIAAERRKVKRKQNR